jgi:hypothetical protein
MQSRFYLNLAWYKKIFQLTWVVEFEFYEVLRVTWENRESKEFLRQKVVCLM